MRRLQTCSSYQTLASSHLQHYLAVGFCKRLNRPKAVDDILGFAKVNLVQGISDLVLHVLNQTTFREEMSSYADCQMEKGVL